MLALALVLVLASGLQTSSEPFDLEATAARYEAECAGGAAGANCETLQAALEDHLFDCLVTLTDARVAVDRETVRVATRAESPTLAAYALALLDAGFGPADLPYVRAALDSPYPQVRQAAVDLSKWIETESLRAPTERAREALADGRSGAGASPLVPDFVPSAEALGAPLYPGARYSYLAGSRARPVFLTADDPQKVAAFLAKGKPTFSAAEMTAAAERRGAAAEGDDDAAAKPAGDDMAAAMAQAAQLMAALNSGKDPMQAVREMGEVEAAKTYDWTSEITGLEGIGAPRFVVVAEKQGVPTRVVAVFADPAVGATAIAYLTPPGAGGDAMHELTTDADAMMRWQKWLRILGP